MEKYNKPIKPDLTEREIENIIKVYAATRKIKAILNGINKQVLARACSPYILGVTTQSQFNNITKLIEEKQQIIEVYHIIEEALKDLYLDDFLLLEWNYIKFKSKEEIIKSFNFSERSFYRKLLFVKNTFVKRVDFYDTQGLVKNYDKYITNKHFLDVVKIYRGNGEFISHK